MDAKTKHTKASLLKRGEQLARDIEQIFTDAEHWNIHVRKANEATINPDPDGSLKRILASLHRAWR